MRARIYRPAKTAMSSGKARTREWILEFIGTKPRLKDDKTGWIRSNETQTQIRLEFKTCEQAQDYARAHGIVARVDVPHKHSVPLKSYAENFRHDRPAPWTH